LFSVTATSVMKNFRYFALAWYGHCLGSRGAEFCVGQLIQPTVSQLDSAPDNHNYKRQI
jgi:hypothetical protein